MYTGLNPSDIRVCHFTSAHDALDERIFLKECRSLQRAGYEVSLVAAGAKSECRDNVKIIGVPRVGKSRLTRMLQTARRVYQRTLELECDIYHFHDPELLRFALKLKRRGKTVIYDCHEDVPKQILTKGWIPLLFRKIVSSAFRRFEDKISKQLDMVIAATPSIAQRFAGISKNVVVINNYPIIGELNKPKDWKSRKAEVCYIGGIAPIRGIIQVVDAMALAPDATLQLVGGMDSDTTETKLSSLAGWGQVHFHGFVSRQEVAEIIGGCRAGLVTFLPAPNHTDSRPNKMFEYMSAGLPVICSNFPAWKEIIEGNSCGICVDPTSPTSIADAIRFILENPQEAKTMGKNGLRAVVEKYSWDAEQAILVESYKRLKT